MCSSLGRTTSPAPYVPRLPVVLCIFKFLCKVRESHDSHSAIVMWRFPMENPTCWSYEFTNSNMERFVLTNGLCCHLLVRFFKHFNYFRTTKITFISTCLLSSDPIGEAREQLRQGDNHEVRAGRESEEGSQRFSVPQRRTVFIHTVGSLVGTGGQGRALRKAV